MSLRIGPLNRIVFLAGALVLSGCDRAPAPAAPATTAGSDYELPSFVGTVWISTTLGSPLGSMRVFLPNRTLVMDSCFETYRLAKWGIISDDTIRWIEDTIPIQATYVQPTKNSLRLKITGMSQEETYVAASVPYVCPDMPR